MKIAIMGVGAIGGYVGTGSRWPARTSHSSRAEQISRRCAPGASVLINADGTEESVPRVKATDDYAAAGPQDVVILAMKAHQVEAVAAKCRSCSARHRRRSDAKRHSLLVLSRSRRRTGRNARRTASTRTGGSTTKIPCERVIGCVVYPAAELVSPGVIRHVEGNRFPVGEPDGTDERARHASWPQCLVNAECRRPCSSDIRSEIWLKLWGNYDLQPDQRAVARDIGRKSASIRRAGPLRPR